MTTFGYIVLTYICLLLAPTEESHESLEQLVEQASAEQSQQRAAALLKIGENLGSYKGTDEKLASQTLIRATADGSTIVSSSAKFRMAENADLVNQYLGSFLKSNEFRTFAQGCEAIKSIGPVARSWLPELEKHLDSTDQYYQLASLHALAVLDGKDALPTLDKVIAALDSKDFNVQLSACRVISKIGPRAKKAGPRLVKLHEEGIASARSWASIALGAIGPHEEYDVVELLEAELDEFYLIYRERALEGLAHLGEKAKPAIPKIE
ncbi:MAG: HEAT repeat domain-containing protein, partial [Planctomycetota bacterium]